jgi:hypothetical protein
MNGLTGEQVRDLVLRIDDWREASECRARTEGVGTDQYHFCKGRAGSSVRILSWFAQMGIDVDAIIEAAK